MHKDKTNAVVAWLRSFEFRNNATIVIKFPENNKNSFGFYSAGNLYDTINNTPNTPTTMKMHAQTAAKIVAACGYTTTDVIVYYVYDV